MGSGKRRSGMVQVPRVVLRTKRGDVKVIQLAKQWPQVERGKSLRIGKQGSVVAPPAPLSFMRRQVASFSPLPPRSWQKWTLSLVGALLLGGTMGASVLQWFLSERSSLLTSVTPGAVWTATFPSFVCTLVVSQATFSPAAANQQAQQDRQQGWASVVLPGSPRRLGWGIGCAREQAVKIVALHRQAGRAALLQEVRIGGKQWPLTQQGNQLIDALGQAQPVIHYLATASAQALPLKEKEVAPLSLPPPLLHSYQTFLQAVTAWEEKGAATQEQWAPSLPLREMVQALQQAVEAAQQAKTAPSPTLFWQIQAAVLRYTVAYEEWVRRWTH